ncbi:Fasciclin-like arabinogalactan protein [Musa troglodytarum]|uniref:Fasciclin-like arabinogalactan protein n=1 Tax=Musa troglodytarum TaxID=320322 RepID=A0A9E7JVV1_9LILI|nr:Fasciclin-like arabinogalactan protein [Musa troglodytarum]
MSCFYPAQLVLIITYHHVQLLPITIRFTSSYISRSPILPLSSESETAAAGEGLIWRHGAFRDVSCNYSANLTGFFSCNSANTPCTKPTSIPFPSPCPAPLHHFLSVTGPFQTFLNYLLQTRVIDTFQNRANNSDQGMTIFSSTAANLTQDQLRILLLYLAFPMFYSLSDFTNLSKLNPVNTFAGGQKTLNVTEAAGLVRIISSWSRSEKSSSVRSTVPVAVYQIDRVLLPLAIFSTDPPLAPAPAPAPEAAKAIGFDSKPRVVDDRWFFIPRQCWSLKLLRLGCFGRSDACSVASSHVRLKSNTHPPSKEPEVKSINPWPDHVNVQDFPVMIGRNTSSGTELDWWSSP